MMASSAADEMEDSELRKRDGDERDEGVLEDKELHRLYGSVGVVSPETQEEDDPEMSYQWDDQDDDFWDGGEIGDHREEMEMDLEDEEEEEERGSDEEEEGEEERRGVEGVDFGQLNIDEQARIAVKNRSVKRFPQFEYSDRLTGDFKLLMGEANLAVAKGNSKTAINICLEIIRNIPDSPAPYETLAVIYEEQGDLYKSLQYGLISAHLWPGDPHKWYSLAQKSQELKDTVNYRVCISKALRYSHLTQDRGFIEEIMGHFSRQTEISEEMSDKISAGYRKLIKIAGDGEGSEMRALVETFESKCEEGGRQESQWALTYTALITRFPDQATVEKIVKCCRVFIKSKKYFRIPPLLLKCGLISKVPAAVGKSTEGEGEEREDPAEMETAIQDRVAEVVAGNTAALCPVPPREQQWAVNEGLTPQLRSFLVTALVYLRHDQENIEELSAPLIGPTAAERSETTAIEPAAAERSETTAIEPAAAEMSETTAIGPAAAEMSETTAIEPAAAEMSETTAIEPAGAGSEESVSGEMGSISQVMKEGTKSPILEEESGAATVPVSGEGNVPVSGEGNVPVSRDSEGSVPVSIENGVPACDLLLLADAHYEANNFLKAKALYERLSRCPECVSDTHTWLLLGHCHDELAEWRDAVRCYEGVLRADPTNSTAKLRLFALQQLHMEEEAAIFTMNIHAGLSGVKELTERPDIVRMSYLRAVELVQEGKHEEAYSEGYPVLRRALLDSIERAMTCKWKPDLRGYFTFHRHYSFLCSLLNRSLGEVHGHAALYKSMLKRREWYEWYTMMVGCCVHLNKHRDALILALAGLSSLLMDSTDPRISKNIQVHTVYLAGYLGHNECVSDTIGSLLYNNPHVMGVWNLFYTIAHRLTRPRLHRLGVRWLCKNKNDYNGLFYNALHTYRHKHFNAGIAFFRQCLAQRPQDPNIYFNLMLFYLHWVSSKNADLSKRRHEFVVQAVACAFMFHQLRGPCQETLYNLGRCYHALGLRHFATIYYKRALYSPAIVARGVQDQLDSMNAERGEGVEPLEMRDIDLTREIVYNLCEVYRASGSDHLARQLLYQHCVI